MSSSLKMNNAQIMFYHQCLYKDICLVRYCTLQHIKGWAGSAPE